MTHLKKTLPDRAYSNICLSFILDDSQVKSVISVISDEFGSHQD